MGNIMPYPRSTSQTNSFNAGGSKIRRISATPELKILSSATKTTINATKIESIYVISSSESTLAKTQLGKMELSELVKEFAREKHSQKGLNMHDKELIDKCWRAHICTRHRDIFHKTMLACVESSPKMNEMIACGRYCYRDLTRWPELNRICQAQFKFFERLIYELHMDEMKMRIACFTLGATHAGYSEYGMKPHFLDMFQQQFLEQLNKVRIGDLEEKRETILAFLLLLSVIIETMNDAYNQKNWEKRRSFCSHQKAAAVVDQSQSDTDL